MADKRPPLRVQDQYNPDVDPKLLAIIEQAAEYTGYIVELRSGYRPTDSRYHGRKKAIDVNLIDPKDGRVLDNYQTRGTSVQDFRSYEEFAQVARAIQMANYPELENKFRWGGYFSSTKGAFGYGAGDFMHFDVAGGNGVGMKAGSWKHGLSASAAKAYGITTSKGMGENHNSRTYLTTLPKFSRDPSAESNIRAQRDEQGLLRNRDPIPLPRRRPTPAERIETTKQQVRTQQVRQQMKDAGLDLAMDPTDAVFSDVRSESSAMFREDRGAGQADIVLYDELPAVAVGGLGSLLGARYPIKLKVETATQVSEAVIPQAAPGKQDRARPPSAEANIKTAQAEQQIQRAKPSIVRIPGTDRVTIIPASLSPPKTTPEQIDLATDKVRTFTTTPQRVASLPVTTKAAPVAAPVIKATEGVSWTDKAIAATKPKLTKVSPIGTMPNFTELAGLKPSAVWPKPAGFSSRPTGHGRITRTPEQMGETDWTVADPGMDTPPALDAVMPTGTAELVKRFGKMNDPARRQPAPSSLTSDGDPWVRPSQPPKVKAAPKVSTQTVAPQKPVQAVPSVVAPKSKPKPATRYVAPAAQPVTPRIPTLTLEERVTGTGQGNLASYSGESNKGLT